MIIGEKPATPPTGGMRASGSVRQRDDRKERLAGRGLGGLEYAHRHVEAAAAIGTGAGPHGQFGHGGTSGGGSLTDLVVGDAIADADVHGGGGATGSERPTAISPGMRMIVNSWRVRPGRPVYVRVDPDCGGAHHPPPGDREAAGEPPAAPRRCGRTKPGAPMHWHRRAA